MSELENRIRAQEAHPAPSRLRRVGVYAFVALAIFMLGFLPAWMSARGRAVERDEALRELRLSRTENRLASAAIDARRGEYEQARMAASDFFTELHAEAERTKDRALDAEQVALVREILSARDDVITLLARHDSAGADRLFDVHAALRNALRKGKTSLAPTARNDRRPG